MVFVGMAGQTTFPICVDGIINKELDVTSVFRHRNVYPSTIALVATGKVDMNPLITHRFPFDKIVEAFASARERKGNAVKVVVSF